MFVKHTPLTYIVQHKLFLRSCNLRTSDHVTGLSMEQQTFSWQITGHVPGVTALHSLGQGWQKHLATVNIRNPNCVRVCVEIGRERVTKKCQFLSTQLSAANYWLCNSFRQYNVRKYLTKEHVNIFHLFILSDQQPKGWNREPPRDWLARKSFNVPMILSYLFILQIITNMFWFTNWSPH